MIGECKEAGTTVRNPIDGILIFHELVIWKIKVILVGKKVKLGGTHRLASGKQIGPVLRQGLKF
jgi:hypothetical protein